MKVILLIEIVNTSRHNHLKALKVSDRLGYSFWVKEGHLHTIFGY